MNTLGKRGYHQLFWFIVGVALLLRLGVGLELLDHPSVMVPDSRTDMATYERLSTEILAGQWPEHFYYQPFYYAVFLPVAHSIFGLNNWCVPWVQSLLGAATVALTGLTAAQLFGRRTGLLAAVFLALARFHVFYTPFRLMSVLLAFELSLLLWLLIGAVRRGGYRRWASASLVLACATLTRGNCALLLPLVVGLAVQQNWKRPNHAIGTVLVIFAVFQAPQLPFALQNYRYYGRWTGPSSAADAVLALSNSPQAPPGGLAPNTEVYRQWMRDARAEGEARVPVKDRVLQWMRRNPAGFLELKWQTFLLFWNAVEIPNNIAMAHEGRESRLVRLPFPLLLDFAVIGSLAIAGLLLCLSLLRRSPALLTAFLLVVLYCAATVMFYMLARFRVPLLPVLCIFAAHAVQRLIRMGGNLLGRRSIPCRNALAVACALLGGVYICTRAYAHYQHVEPAILRRARPYGTAFETDKGAIVHDHGPQLTGGWGELVLPETTRTLMKEFVLPPWLRSQDWQVIHLEVPVPTEGERSWRWRRIPARVESEDGARFSVSLPVNPSQRIPFLILDTDRNYRRTRLRGTELPVPGELVARLVLVRP